MTKEKTFKLDIFELLSEIDKGNLSYWRQLTEEQQKAFAPLVVMRWMTGTSDQRQIIALNTFANHKIFSLGKHPELLMKLLTACSSKKSGRRYYWLGTKSKKKQGEAYKIMQEYFQVSAREVKNYHLPPLEELVRMAEELGYQKDEIAKLQKEFKR